MALNVFTISEPGRYDVGSYDFITERPMEEIEEIVATAHATAAKLCDSTWDRVDMVAAIVSKAGGIRAVNNLHRKTFVID